MWAAIVANLNSIRSRDGKPPLGFLNPWLYSITQGLTDIVEGGTTGCTGTSRRTGDPAQRIPGAGWNATEGWDPATGLGTPVFSDLVEAMP